VAAEETPTCRAAALLAPTDEPPSDEDPGVVAVLVLPGGGAPGPVDGPPPGATGADEDTAPGVPPPNWPPSVLPWVAPFDGARITRTICAATSNANGA
jgi:hypothetical protein